MDTKQSGDGNGWGPADDERLLRRLEATRAMLMREFKIDAMFIGVPKLARILGIAPSTIYGYLRAGTFFIPHRMVHTTPMVSVDDLARWICSTASIEPAQAASAPEAAGSEDSARTDSTPVNRIMERARGNIASEPAEPATRKRRFGR